MTDPRRLLDDALGESGEDDASRLLRSARFDSPSNGSRDRAAIALGLATGVALGTASASAAGAGAAGSGAAGTAKVGALGGAALLKWIGIGVAGAFVAATAVKVVAPRDAGDRDRVRPVTTATAPARDPFAVIPPPPPPFQASRAPDVRATSAESTSATASPASSAPEARSVHGATSAATSASGSIPPPASGRAPSITDEIASLDQARTALASGDTGSTLRVLDAYDRAFPNGALAPEASVLRIDALADSGDETRARAEANRFLTAHPNGPQSRHVRSRIDRMTNP